MNKSIATRTAALLAAATLASGVTTPRPASAADVTFPNSDGSRQILSPAAWGGSVPTTDRPKFNVAFGRNTTYLVDRDGSLNGLYIDAGTSANDNSAWGNISFTFQFQNDAKLILGGPIRGYRNWSNPDGWATVSFLNGNIDFGANDLWSGNQAYWTKLIFADCTVTNVDNMFILNQCKHGHLVLSNSVVWVNHYLMPTFTLGLTDDRIFINSGSKVSAGQFTMSRSYNGGNVTKHTDGLPLVDISGSGTKVVFRGDKSTSTRSDGIDDEVSKGYSLLASLGSGEIFRIGDGAKVTVESGYAIIGIKEGANNRVIVEGDGSELTIDEYAFAWRGNKTTGSTNNYIIVRDGGKLVSGTAGYNSGTGTDNGIICSNGTVITRGPKYYNNNTSNPLTFRMQGDNPSVSFIAGSYSEGAYLTCGLNWVFDLPAGGYRTGCVPFKFNSTQYLTANANSSNLTCEINGLAEFCQDMRTKGDIHREVTLIGGTGSFSSASVNQVTYSREKYDEAVERWNTELQAKVPTGFKASLVRSGKSVTLDVKRILATVISIH